MSALTSEQTIRCIANAQNGDQSAFAELIKSTQNLTTSLALSIVKDIDASEDIAQQVYIKIWKKLPTLSNPRSFLPWLRQVTRFTAYNYLRDSKAEQRLDSESAQIVLDSLSDDTDLTDNTLNSQQLSNRLSLFIDALPDEDKALVLLYYREQESTGQVAHLLDLSEANVRQKLTRIRKNIKQKWLSKYGKVILNTAPSLGFSTIVTGMLTTTSPSAAAAVSASISSSSSSIWVKMLAWLGGSVIGAGLAALAVFFSTKMLIANIEDKSFTKNIERYRNLMFLWIGGFAILLVLSYEFTQGWWAPVLSYALFSFGLVRLIELSQYTAVKAGLKKGGRLCVDPTTAGWKLRLLNWAGPLLGSIGLFAGLFQSGRLL